MKNSSNPDAEDDKILTRQEAVVDETRKDSICKLLSY